MGSQEVTSTNRKMKQREDRWEQQATAEKKKEPQLDGHIGPT